MTFGMTEASVSPDKMHVRGFVDAFVRIDRMMADRRFAFILGAGASQSSGIQTGGELVREWLEILFQRDPARGPRDFDAWLVETKAGIAGFEPSRGAEFYPQVYAAAFGHDPAEGFAYLENAMAKAEPAYGYAVLADLLERTRHKVVITTNFDNLVADSLANFASTSPLVCGHDSLAGFAQPNLRRPLILKVHHDLLLGPCNRPEETAEIGDGYREAVRRLLQHYTPIVVGYGGNDGSLMGVLADLEQRSVPGGIYWCYRECDDLPREEIQLVVERQCGWLVPILGFDELMAMLASRLEYSLPDVRIQDRAEERARRLVDHATDLRKRLTEEVEVERQRPAPSAESRPTLAVVASEALQATLERVEGKRRWWQWEEEAEKLKKFDPQRADEIYQEALKQFPDSTELLGNYAFFVETERGDLDRAQQLYERAIKSDRPYANNLGNYANFLWHTRQDPDRAQGLYERALEADPGNAVILGNYAGFLFSRGKREQAALLLVRSVDRFSRFAPRDLYVEILFYAYAHLRDSYPRALSGLKRLLVQEGVRSPSWDLSDSVERAVLDGHPEAAWLPKLAEVVSGNVGSEVLDGWEAWSTAEPLSAGLTGRDAFL